MFVDAAGYRTENNSCLYSPANRTKVMILSLQEYFYTKICTPPAICYIVLSIIMIAPDELQLR